MNRAAANDLSLIKQQKNTELKAWQQKRVEDLPLASNHYTTKEHKI